MPDERGRLRADGGPAPGPGLCSCGRPGQDGRLCGQHLLHPRPRRAEGKIEKEEEEDVYAAIGKQAQRKHRGESVAIVVAGCVAQQEGERLLRRVPELDLVMGPQYANRLGDLLEDVVNGNQVVATDPTLIMEDVSKPRRGSATCAWVNVIYGCNEHCTYCVVPGTRGVEQSRPKESIRREIEELAAAGG
ncbi:unnamed protein product [Heterosigma akashiwo]